jgi:galactose oxidase
MYNPRRPMLFALACCLVPLSQTASAQVKEVVIGLTPSCPYGIAGCWGGAREALARLDGVESVAASPDVYNCTAHVKLNGKGLPNPETMQKQFKDMVGDLWAFRGIEVSVEGTNSVQDGKMSLTCPGVAKPILLVPLKNKLQWNFAKHAARKPEPDEATAHQEMHGTAANNVSKLENRWIVTGPLRLENGAIHLEVREAFAQRN